MVRSTPSPEPKEFPDPQTWGTWIAHRSPQFKTHSTLGQCKNALAGKMKGGSAKELPCDMYVYAWDAEVARWVEWTKLPKGTTKADHELFQTVVKNRRNSAAPSKKAVEAAMASILRTTED